MFPFLSVSLRQSAHSFTGWVLVFVFAELPGAQALASSWSARIGHSVAVRHVPAGFAVSCPVPVVQAPSPAGPGPLVSAVSVGEVLSV